MYNWPSLAASPDAPRTSSLPANGFGTVGACRVWPTGGDPSAAHLCDKAKKEVNYNSLVSPLQLTALESSLFQPYSTGTVVPKPLAGRDDAQGALEGSDEAKNNSTKNAAAIGCGNPAENYAHKNVYNYPTFPPAAIPGRLRQYLSPISSPTATRLHTICTRAFHSKKLFNSPVNRYFSAVSTGLITTSTIYINILIERAY